MISRNRRLRLVSWKLAAPMFVLLWWNPAAAQDNSIMEMGSKRELFVDGYLIEKSSGVRLQLHHPMPKEIVMRHDKLWEGNGCNYYSIFRDGDLFRMYYDSWAHEPSSIPVHDVFIGYAESRDGKTWTRPDVGRFEFNGSRKNNIVWASEKLDNWGAFKDTNPDCAPEARYKAFYNGNGGLMAAQSADGIHWSPIGDEPVLTDGAFDSHNLAFWDHRKGHYRAYYRDFRDGLRDIKTATSRDFIHWTRGEWLEYPGGAARAALHQQHHSLLPGSPHLPGLSGPLPGPGLVRRHEGAAGAGGTHGAGQGPQLHHGVRQEGDLGAVRDGSDRRALHEQPRRPGVPPLGRSLHPAGAALHRQLGLRRQLSELGPDRDRVGPAGRSG